MGGEILENSLLTMENRIPRLVLVREYNARATHTAPRLSKKLSRGACLGFFGAEGRRGKQCGVVFRFFLKKKKTKTKTLFFFSFAKREAL